MALTFEIEDVSLYTIDEDKYGDFVVIDIKDEITNSSGTERRGSLSKVTVKKVGTHFLLE